jgi:hypothetical protein
MLRRFRIAAFLALITLPLITMDSGRGPLTNEKRQRAPRPSLRVAGATFPEQFDAFFRDRFGFRERLIRWHNVLKVKYLRESPVPNVIVGDNGWLFYAGIYDGIDIRDFAGRFPAAELNLDGCLRRQLTRHAELAARGIRYLIVLIPNKQTVYPESVPRRYGPHAPGTLDAWLARAQTHPELEVIDLRSILQAHRDEPTFYRADSHWNSNGAFYAAQAIVARARAWFPSVEPLRREDYIVTTAPRPVNDLARMLALNDAFSETRYVYERRGDTGAHLTRLDRAHRVWERPGTSLPRLLLLGDSFGPELADRLADSFARVHYYHSVAGYKDELVTDEQPDVVVLALVERNLGYLSQ